MGDFLLMYWWLDACFLWLHCLSLSKIVTSSGYCLSLFIGFRFQSYLEQHSKFYFTNIGIIITRKSGFCVQRIQQVWYFMWAFYIRPSFFFYLFTICIHCPVGGLVPLVIYGARSILCVFSSCFNTLTVAGALCLWPSLRQIINSNLQILISVLLSEIPPILRNLFEINK